MSFFNINILTFLISIIFLVSGGWMIWCTHKLNKKFEQSVFSKLRNYIFSKKVLDIRYLCLCLCLCFITLAVLRPQWGTKKTTIQSNGVDVIFTLDVSQSMKAQDLSDGGRVLDRLTGAKYMIKDFVQKQPGNRYGLVIFAGEAFVSTPLTFDHAAFFTFLDGVNYDDVGTQGTLLSEAIKASLDRFLKQDDEDPRGKAIILISDGGEEMDEATERFAEVAKEDGIRVVTIGIGSEEGVPIPESRDFFGNVSYKQHKGEVVYTKLNEDTLREIANMTDGQYFHVEKAGDLEIITQELEQLQKSKLEQTVENMREDRYQWFLLPAFLCFLVFVFLPKKKMEKGFFQQIKKLKCLWIFIPFFLTGCDALTRYQIDQGNEKFQKQYLKEAEEIYKKAENNDDIGYMAMNNRGIIGYTQRDFEKAKTLLQSLAEKSCEKESGQDYCDEIYYNLGNALYRFGEESQDPSIQVDQWSQAASAYEKTLQINPEDKEAQDNLVFVQQKLQETQSQQSQQGQEGQQRDSSENQQGQNGEPNEGNEKREGAPSGENQEDQNGEEGEKSEAQKAAEKAAEDAKYGLDENLEQQVEEYMQQMKQNESHAQQHFQRNPEAQQQDSNDPFNDPFFQQFFGGRPQQRDFKGNGEGKQLEKDW